MKCKIIFIKNLGHEVHLPTISMINFFKLLKGLSAITHRIVGF